MTPSRFACTAYHAPKRDHAADEYEDAWAANPELGRFALADGATESSFANIWAQLVVNAYVTQPQLAIDELRQQWSDQVDGLELPWYAEEKRAIGAYATFVGLHIRNDGQWKAFAHGDSCLAHLREGQLLAFFPMRHSTEFTTSPPLISSREGTPEWVRLAGHAEPGDRFCLMSDAMAQWFLRIHERGQSPDMIFDQWQQDRSLFQPWLRQERESGMLTNDDTTLLEIRFLPYESRESR